MVPEDRAVDLMRPQPLLNTLLDAVTHREAHRLGPGWEAVIHEVHAVLQRPQPYTLRLRWVAPGQRCTLFQLAA